MHLRTAKRRWSAGLLGLAALFMPVGCGRRGTPRPPQFVIPEAPTELRVRSKPGGLEISFVRPDRTVDGMDMSDLGALELWRSCEPQPEMSQISSIPIVDRGSFRKTTRFTLLDPTPAVDQSCVYRVIAVTTDGYRSAPAQTEPVRRQSAAEAK